MIFGFKKVDIIDIMLNSPRINQSTATPHRKPYQQYLALTLLRESPKKPHCVHQKAIETRINRETAQQAETPFSAYLPFQQPSIISIGYKLIFFF
jgi:hypothetical protein